MSTFLFQIPAGEVEPGGPLPGAEQGNIGLHGPSIVMLRLTEPAGVRPADAAGNLADLASSPGHAPVPVAAWTGRGRAFDPADETELYAVDRDGRDTLSTRDVSIQAILAIRAVPFGEPGVVYTRGDGSPDDRTSVALQTFAEDGTAYVTLRWQDTAGNLKLATATVPHAGDDEFILLTVTRRWESSSRIVVRHYVGDALILETTLTGDIAGATTSPTWVGSDGTGARYFAGVIDELRVTDYEITAEEVAATWARLSVYQPAGVAMLRGLLPPGVRWLDDPTTRIGRLMRIAGQGLGYAMATAAEVRATWLPDRAYREIVERWEAIRGVAPRPRDSLDTRRARLASLFRREHGYSLPAIREALAELFDQEPDDVMIDEFTNTILDPFDTYETLRYEPFPTLADWNVAGGTLRATRTTGANLFTSPSMASMNLASSEGTWFTRLKIDAAPAFPVNTSAGLFMQGSTGERSFLGVVNNGGSYALAERNVANVSSVVLATPWSPGSPLWLRVAPVDGSPGEYRFEYCLVPTLDTWFSVYVEGHVVAPVYVGPAVWGSDATVGAVEVRFDDFLTHTPRGLRPFSWYAYRDLLLPGSPDMEGTRALVRKLKPAHTHGAAITRRSVVCDSSETVTDREPLGGI